MFTSFLGLITFVFLLKEICNIYNCFFHFRFLINLLITAVEETLMLPEIAKEWKFITASAFNWEVGWYSHHHINPPPPPYHHIDPPP